MLALFVKIPTMLRLRKIRSFSADSKYTADHSPLLRFPHLRWSRLNSTTGGSPIGSEVLLTKDVNLKRSTVYHTFLYIWTQVNVNLRNIYINLENLREYPHKWTLYCLNLVIGLHIRSWQYGLSSNFRGMLRKTHVLWNRVRNGPSRSSKVMDFGSNRKRVCDFLLVINSNFDPILPHFRDIAGFLRTATPLLFHPNFRYVPLD